MTCDVRLQSFGNVKMTVVNYIIYLKSVPTGGGHAGAPRILAHDDGVTSVSVIDAGKDTAIQEVILKH